MHATAVLCHIATDKDAESEKEHSYDGRRLSQTAFQDIILNETGIMFFFVKQYKIMPCSYLAIALTILNV